MFIASGKEYVLKGPGEYVVKDVEIVGSSGMPPTTRETEWRASNKVLVQVAQTSAASVRMRSIAAPKVDTAPKLLFPTAGQRSRRCSRRSAGARADAKAPAEFTLMRRRARKSPCTRRRSPANTYGCRPKLRPDTEYTWTVSVAGNEIGIGQVPHAARRCARARRQARPSDKADFTDRVLFTLMLQEMGATQEAQESWAHLVAGARATCPSSPHSRSRCASAFAGALVGVAALAAQARPIPVAFVADIQGSATIEGDGKARLSSPSSPRARALAARQRRHGRGHLCRDGRGVLARRPGRVRRRRESEVKADKGATPKPRGVAALPEPTVVVTQAAKYRDGERAHAWRVGRKLPPEDAARVSPGHAHRDACSRRCAGAAIREPKRLQRRDRRRRGKGGLDAAHATPRA